MPAESSVFRDESPEARLPAGGAPATVSPAPASRLGVSRLLLLLVAAAVVGAVMLDPAWITASNEGMLAVMGLLWVGVLVAKGASRG